MSIRQDMRATCAVCIIWVRANPLGLALSINEVDVTEADRSIE